MNEIKFVSRVDVGTVGRRRKTHSSLKQLACTARVKRVGGLIHAREREVTTALFGMPRARMIHQHVAHHARRKAHEMGVFHGGRLPVTLQAQESLVHHGGGRLGVVGGLLPHLTARDALQLGIQGRAKCGP